MFATTVGNSPASASTSSASHPTSRQPSSGEKNVYGKTVIGMTRSSFLVGEDGVVARAWYRVKPDQTVPKARAAIEELGQIEGADR
jgi:peroxiredoxin